MARTFKILLQSCTLLSSLLLLMLLRVASANTAEENYQADIMTGGPKGTYAQFGRDIRDLALGCHINVDVVESEGSLANIYAIIEKPATPFGIVQSDVLEYMLSFVKSDRDIRSMVARTGVVFPLYNEEVHVLARAGMDSLEDLKGRRVGVGAAGSGTNLTATTVLGISHIPVKEQMLSAADNLTALRSNSLDAFFYVSGAPDDFLLHEITPEDNFELVAIASPALLDRYQPVKILKETYPWLKKDVQTIAAKAVLMTYDYDPSGNKYQRQSCTAVSEVTYLIAHNLRRLQAQGHKKWNDV